MTLIKYKYWKPLLLFALVPYIFMMAYFIWLGIFIWLFLYLYYVGRNDISVKHKVAVFVISFLIVWYIYYDSNKSIVPPMY